MIYNQFDSYYSGVGKDLLDEIKEMMEQDNFEEWLALFLQLKMVTEADIPTDEDIEKCKDYYDSSVSSQRPEDFYCLLRKCQGSFKRVLQSGYALIQKDGSLENSLFIEYCYLLDFDEKNFYFSHHNVVRYYRLCDTKYISRILEGEDEED